MFPAAQVVDVVNAPSPGPVYISSLWDLTVGVVLTVTGIVFVYFAKPQRPFRVLCGYLVVLLILASVLYPVLVNAAEKANEASNASRDDILGGDFLAELVDRIFAAQALGCMIVAAISLVAMLGTYLAIRLRHRVHQP